MQLANHEAFYERGGRVKSPSKKWKLRSVPVIIGVFVLFAGLSTEKAFAITSPTEITGLQLWLDTSQPNSLFKDVGMTLPATAESDKIALWKDWSGNNFHATNTNATYQPTLTLNQDGGYSGVKFGTNANILLNIGNPDLLNFTNTSSTTIFIVYKKIGSSDNSILHKGTSLGTGHPDLFLYSSGTVGEVGSNSNPGGLQSSLHANIFSYVHDYRGAFTYDIFYLNNIASLSSGGNNQASSTRTWNLGGDTAYPFNGYIQAVYIYDRALLPTEISEVNNYLASKFVIYNA